LRQAAHPAAHPDKPRNRAAIQKPSALTIEAWSFGFPKNSSSPMTSTATPISAATEQQHYQNDNQDQFHGISPLTAMAFFAACQAFNGVFEALFRTSLQPS
jgi:hypothetical protein